MKNISNQCKNQLEPKSFRGHPLSFWPMGSSPTTLFKKSQKIMKNFIFDFDHSNPVEVLLRPPR
jgi:hypothetical protein